MYGLLHTRRVSSLVRLSSGRGTSTVGSFLSAFINLPQLTGLLVLRPSLTSPPHLHVPRTHSRLSAYPFRRDSSTVKMFKGFLDSALKTTTDPFSKHPSPLSATFPGSPYTQTTRNPAFLSTQVLPKWREISRQRFHPTRVSQFRGETVKTDTLVLVQ